MFRRRQPALIASLATLASVGLVVPGVAAGVPVYGASIASQAAARVAVPAATAAVLAGATPAIADVVGAAPSDSAVEPTDEEVVEEQGTEPAPESVDEPPATTVPAGEPAASTTTVPAGEEPATETTTTIPDDSEPSEPPPTTAPDGDPAGDEPGTDPATTTTLVPADEPSCEAAPDSAATTTTTAPEPAEESTCELTTEPPTTTTTTTPPTTTTTAPAEGSDEEPGVDPTTETTTPTTVPAPVDDIDDDQVDGAGDDGEDGSTITPSGEESSDAATVRETAQRGSEADDDEPAADVDQPVVPAPPIDTTPAELNTYDPGLRASRYDGVYAEGVPVGVAMATTRWLESGNRYDAQARGSTASGAYQILDSTWNGYGGYARAVLAPPEVQDQFAYESFTALLKRHGNDVSTIPVSWYIGHVPRGAEWDTVPKPEAGNRLTPRQYQAKWMTKFFSLLAEGAPVYLPSDTEALIPAIAFPVLGPVEFVDDWHFERDGGARRHEGLDLIGYEGQPIRAVFDGVITMIDDDPSGIAGNGLRLTRDDGLYANYFHLSNSETGPVHSSLEVGTRVRAGQIIGYMGSTGNAGIPHLHFELRTAEREPMAPYPAVMEAVQREQCTVGLGPWSTEFTSPTAQAEAVQAYADLTAERVEGLLDPADAKAASLEAFADLTAAQATILLDLADDEAATEAFADLAAEQVEVLTDLAGAPAEGVDYLTIEGPDGAQWVIGSDGSVTASGQAAMIGTYQTDCPMPIETTDQAGDPIMFGTDSEGLAVDELPVGWWDDEAVEWAPDLDGEENYVDPWELDQAELDLAGEHHAEHDGERLGEPRHLKMI